MNKTILQTTCFVLFVLALATLPSCKTKTPVYQFELTLPNGQKTKHEVTSKAVLNIELDSVHYGIRLEDNPKGGIDFALVRVDITNDTVGKETTITSKTIAKQTLREKETGKLATDFGDFTVVLAAVNFQPGAIGTCGPGTCCTVITYPDNPDRPSQVVCCGSCDDEPTGDCLVCKLKPFPTGMGVNPNGPAQPSTTEFIRKDQTFSVKQQ